MLVRFAFLCILLGSWLPMAYPVANAQAPGAPTSLTVTSTSATSIGLSWTAPADDGNGALDGYNVYRCTQGAGVACTPAWLAWVNASAGTTYTDSSVTSGSTYRYVVGASRGSDRSDWSNEVTAIAQVPQTPAAPTGLSGRANNSKAVLSWTAPAGTVTGYTLYRGDGSTCNNLTSSQTGIGASATSVEDTSVTAGSTYCYAISATNNVGEGSKSSTETVKAVTVGKPTGLTVTSTSATTIGLSWTAPASDGGGTLDGYNVYRCTQGVGVACTTVWLAWVKASAGTTYTDSSVTAGSNYRYDVAAYRVSGGSRSDQVTAQVLDKVAGFTATAGSDSSIVLSWTAVTGATGYKVQYKSGSQDWSSTRQFTPTTNSQNVASANLTTNTAYTFRVAATNAVGDGAWSDEVVATPVNATLRASGVEASTATLTIANHTGTWYYKRTSPSVGNCAGPVSVPSTQDSGLAPGYTHTFSAYADSQCTGTVLATTPQFLTKPGKAAGVSATAANGALDVSWTATTGASSYKIQWKSSSDADWDATSRQTTSTTASATIPSLTNDTTYTVRVAAVNDTGDGAWSDTATGTPSGRTLNLVTAAANGGVFALSSGTTPWYSKVTPPANATCETNNALGKTVTGKSSGTSYTLTAYSDSSCNTKLTSLGFTTLPAKVAGVAATAHSASLGVSWTAEAGSAPASYKVQWRSSTDTDWDAANRQTVTTKTRASLTGLTNGTQYTIRVAATTAGGDGAWSDNATGTPSATAVTLTVGGVTATSGVITMSNQSGDWWYSPDGGTLGGRCLSGPSGGTFVVLGDSGTEYTVTAYSNSTCSTALASVDFITLPAKTTGVTLSNRGASLGVSWTAATGAASYKVQWKSSADSGWDAANRQTTSTTTSATIPSLTNNTAYSVRVAAVNADGGEGAWSDTATLTPTVTLTESNVTATGAKLTVAGHTGTAYLSGRGGNSYTLACTAVSGSTHSPTLQGNTTYEFKAYGNSSCTGTALASTTFTTPGAVKLFADNITQHYAMLYLEGWGSLPNSAHSYVVHEAGSSSPHRRCNADSRPNPHTPYTGLEPGTTYTARYFRGNSCAAIEQLASVTFTTLSEGASPELSVSNVTNTGATLTISNHTGNWWYENDDVADSCTAVTGGATTAHLSGLTANTNYAFVAWSHAGCAEDADSGVWYSRQAFTTTGPLTVAVGGKTSTGLTVNLRGYTEANGYPDQWSVRVVRPDGSNGYIGSACQTLPRATTSATVTGLEAGKSYTIQINKLAHCNSLANIVNETPVTTVSLVSGSVGPSSATLTLGNHEGAWSYKGGETAGGASGAGAQSTGGAGAQSGGGDATNQCQAMTAGQTTANLSGLKSDTSYTYTAYNGADCAGQALAQTAFATPPPPVPDAPAGLSAAAGDASVTLTWSDPSDSSITGYEYQVNHNDTDTGKLTGWGDWTAIDGWSADTTSHAVTGLTNGNEYRFRLRARNDAGASANAPRADPWYVSATPQAPVNPVAPEPPASVTVTRGDGTLNVSWPAVEGAASYHVTYSSNNGASWSLAVERHPDASIEITGIDNALTYVVGVRARNAAGDSGWVNSPPAGPYSAEPPATPSSVTVARGDGTLHASWPAVAGATSYHITYSSDNGASWSLAALHHPTNAIEIAGVDNALTYIVGVRARNAHGDSDWRNSPPAGPGAWVSGDGAVAMSGMEGASGAVGGAATSSSPGPAGAGAYGADGGIVRAGFAPGVVADLAPGFAPAAAIGAAAWKQNLPIEPLALPAAEGGDGQLAYSLSPEPPEGVTLDPATRTLSGTPTAALDGARYTWRASDADGDAAELGFSLSVEADFAPAFAGAGPRTLRLERLDAMEPLTLPQASGGDGELAYAISGDLPAGLSFDAATRTLSGTPTEAGAARALRYTATDADPVGPDTAGLTFTVQVSASAADKAIVGDALAAQGRALLTSATSVIGERFRSSDAASADMTAPRGSMSRGCAEAQDGDAAGPDGGVDRDGFESRYGAISHDAAGESNGSQHETGGAAGSGCADGGDPMVEAVNMFAVWLAGRAGGVPGGGYAVQGGFGGGVYPAANGVPGGGHAASSGVSSGFGGGTGFGAGSSFGVGPGFASGAGAGPRYGLTGPGGASAAFDPAHGVADGNGARDWNLGGLLAGRSFSVPLPAAGGDGREPPQSRWTLWGAADAQRFDGATGVGRYDGEMSSLYLGADRRFGAGQWLAGTALSLNSGESRYSADGREGRLDTALAALHPYIHGETRSGLELWFMGGVGAGEANDRPGLSGAGGGEADHHSGLSGVATAGTEGHPGLSGIGADETNNHSRPSGTLAGGAEDNPEPDGAPVHSAGLKMMMAAAGLRQPLARRGAVEFSLVGGLGKATLGTGAGGGWRAVEGLDLSVSQGRLALEVSRAGGRVSPYLRLGARADGGDGPTGTGAEAVAGLSYSGPRVDFEAQARWMSARSGSEYEEYGGTMRLTVKAREDGSGLRLSLAPAWGQAGTPGAMLGGGEGLLGGTNSGALLRAGGIGGFGGASGTGGTMGEALPGLGPMSLESELGYGFAFERGLLTLGATHTRHGPDARESIDLGWESSRRTPEPGPGGDLKLRLGYDLPTPLAEGGPRLDLTYAARF